MTNQTGLKIQSAGADTAVTEILHQLQADGGDEGLTLRLLPGEAPGLSVKREGDVLSVAYSERAYLFRGLGLAVEHGAEENLALEQTSVFEGNGLMLDCSRNAVPTLATVKDMIRQLALMGHNTLMLYTEDTYELEDEPYFGYMRGRYTREELRELDDELHNNDTVQEKLSLAARFGVTIYYGSPDKFQFQKIVSVLAERYHVNLPEEELYAEANKWELSHGGLSGRTASQFITHLLGTLVE